MTGRPLDALRGAILSAVAVGTNTRDAMALDGPVQAFARRAALRNGTTMFDEFDRALRQLWQGGHLVRADPAVPGVWVVARREYPPGPLQCALLAALRQGPGTSTELAERTGGRRPSIWRAANRLCSRGLVEIVERRPARRGKPAPVFGLVTPS